MAELGHVVFCVRQLEPAVHFYSGIVALAVVGRICHDRAALLSGGRTAADRGRYHPRSDGRAAAGIEIEGTANRTVSQRLYRRDPDGNEVELFVDDPASDGRRDPSWMETPVKPLAP